jgi:hypothetical protein
MTYAVVGEIEEEQVAVLEEEDVVVDRLLLAAAALGACTIINTRPFIALLMSDHTLGGGGVLWQVLTTMRTLLGYALGVAS